MNKSVTHTRSYRQGHPNPQKFRESYTVLNGVWDFAFDEQNSGIKKHFEQNFPSSSLKINVPYPYQSPASGINLPDKQCDVVWYERTFEVDDLSSEYVITFQSVDYKTVVYINGCPACEHEGGYDIFTVNATPFVKLGTNKLTLRVEDEMRMDQIRGKQRWRRDSFTCFYTETSGIVRDVYMEKLATRHIDDFKLRADYESKILSVDAKIADGAGATLLISLSDKEGKEVASKSVLLDGDSVHTDMVLDFVNAWSHENPYLYDLTFTLSDGEWVFDKVLSYCGFVTFGIKDKHFYVNGVDTYLKFVLDQGYWTDTITTPTEKEIAEDVERTLACGFNGSRMHEHTPSPLNFYYADIYGLYVWHECPSPYGYSYYSNKQCRAQFPRIIDDHYSHPSIMAYVIFNESWGIDDVRRNREIQELTVDLYNQVKAIAGSRFVISNDGWEHTVSDVLTFHNYLETYEELNALFGVNLPATYAGENVECVEGKRKFFSGDYRYSGQPVMLSEFAGIAFDSDAASGWGYGKSVGTQQDFLDKYSAQLRFILEREEIRGFCMTQLTDVYQEKNGLYTMDREQKLAPEIIKELHEQFK